jgi:hypothetical protein
MVMSPDEFYKAAKLAANPFRTNPIEEADPRIEIWVGYKKEREQLTKYLERTRGDQVGNTNLVMIYGDYGTGKSHALLWARSQILQRRKSEFRSVAYYIQNLRSDGGKISFAGAFREEIVGKSNLVKDVLDYKVFLEEQIVRLRSEKGGDSALHNEPLLKELLPSVEFFNFARRILSCTSEIDVRNLLIGDKKLSDYTAMQLITRIINLFVYEFKLQSGTRRFRLGAYIFVDEVDLLLTASAKEMRETNELFRHIYDNCPNCMCLVLAFTAAVSELTILFDPYLLSRTAKHLKMELLSNEEAADFVREMLDSSRPQPGEKLGNIPFTADAIESIVSRMVSITPRQLMNVMLQVLEECRLGGVNPSTDLISTQTLETHNIFGEVLGS